MTVATAMPVESERAKATYSGSKSPIALRISDLSSVQVQAGSELFTDVDLHTV